MSYSPRAIAEARIHEVDRKNTDARLSPCKILKLLSNGPDTSYKVSTKERILKNSLKPEDVRNVHFHLLQNIET